MIDSESSNPPEEDAIEKDGAVSKSVALYSDADCTDAAAPFKVLLLSCFSLKITAYNIMCNDSIPALPDLTRREHDPKWVEKGVVGLVPRVSDRWYPISCLKDGSL